MHAPYADPDAEISSVVWGPVNRRGNAMIPYIRVLPLVSAALLSACASTFTHTWRNPDATQLGLKGEKVVAIVLVKDESTRKLAENRLAQQIAVRGAQGRTMYSLVPGATAGNEQETRAALEAQGVKGAVVMRPVHIDRTVHITPAEEEAAYASFWGGYYGYGFSFAYSSGSEEQVSETTVVYVETLVYSLKQNKLVWSGQSKSTNPDTVTELIEELTAAATAELKKEGLIN
jgi:hypothetical protein